MTLQADPSLTDQITRKSSHGRITLAVAGWCLAPIPTLIGWFIGNPIIPLVIGALLFAAMGATALRMESRQADIGVCLAMVGQTILMTASLAGHGWQIDSHMVFFAVLACTIILNDASATLAAAVAIVAHHLLLSAVLPALLYPPANLLTDIARTLMHGAIVGIETTALLWSISIRQRLDFCARDDAAIITMARAKAEEALAQATLDRAESDALRMNAEAATTRATAEAAKSAQILTELKAAEEKELERQALASQHENEQSERVALVVDELRAGLRLLSDKKLDQRIDVVFSEKYEELRHDFNAAVYSLRKTMIAVLEGADSIGVETAQISTATKNLAIRTENQAKTLADVAQSVSSINEKVKETANLARTTQADAVQMEAETKKSTTLVKSAEAAMSQIEQSSQQIASIIKVIEDISFQTNLLALNAGVEAARAGDSGRGFAVVAAEVRALAMRSSKAANEIKILIETSGQQVGDGVNLVQKTGQALRKTTDRIVTISSRVTQMADSAVDQATMVGQIDKSLAELDNLTQRNSAAFEETTAASASVASSVQHLVKTIAAFLPAHSR